MTYDKYNWTTGEVITADKLNHMEDGIENADGGGNEFVFTVTVDMDTETCTCDKTFAQIKDAILGKKIIVAYRHEIEGADSITSTYTYIALLNYDGEETIVVHYLISINADYNAAEWETIMIASDDTITSTGGSKPFAN